MSCSKPETSWVDRQPLDVITNAPRADTHTIAQDAPPGHVLHGPASLGRNDSNHYQGYVAGALDLCSSFKTSFADSLNLVSTVDSFVDATEGTEHDEDSRSEGQPSEAFSEDQGIPMVVAPCIRAINIGDIITMTDLIGIIQRAFTTPSGPSYVVVDRESVPGQYLLFPGKDAVFFLDPGASAFQCPGRLLKDVFEALLPSPLSYPRLGARNRVFVERPNAADSKGHSRYQYLGEYIVTLTGTYMSATYWNECVPKDFRNFLISRYTKTVLSVPNDPIPNHPYPESSVRKCYDSSDFIPLVRFKYVNSSDAQTFSIEMPIVFDADDLLESDSDSEYSQPSEVFNEFPIDLPIIFDADDLIETDSASAQSQSSAPFNESSVETPIFFFAGDLMESDSEFEPSAPLNGY
ncbi:hypothetical protein B0H10DRAFT_1947254 [Mycena sp. CBHHK59/15]|nr:hypothetical protein B0H10DRAFT_1947254 [Mycena sp. CBHHK59/15]